MSASGIVDVLGALVTVAMVATIVSSPNSANVIKAFGSGFSQMLLSAQGKSRG
jgi:hypothetical protein